MAAHPDLHDTEWVSMTFLVIAVVVTCFRFYLRMKRKTLGWDDSFALLGMLSMSILVTGTFVLANYANETRIAFYLTVLGYYVAIWSARLSILFTIVRFAPKSRQRIILRFITGFFVFQEALLITQAVWIFELTDSEWVTGSIRQPFAVSLTELLTTIISTLFLVALPAWIIRGVRINAGLRVRLISVFSLSMVTTFAAIAHFVMFNGIWMLLTAVAEVFVSLMVCNAPVLIPAVLRQFSDSATFIESPDHLVATIGGSNRHRTGTAIALTPVNDHERSKIVVHVVVSVDDENPKPTAY